MVCSGFIFGLILFWSPDLRIKMFYKNVSRIEDATHILVDGKMTKYDEVCALFSSDIDSSHRKNTFIFRFIKFKYDDAKMCFVPLQFNTRMSYTEIIDHYKNGRFVSEIEKLRFTYGECQLNVPRKSIPRLLVDEILNPFYIF